VSNSHSAYSRRTLLKGLAAGSAALVLGDYPVYAAGGGKGKLTRATPESLGVDPAAVLAFVEGVEQKVGGLHSFMLLRHGQVAAEGWWTPYAPQHPHMLFSLSKSFTSTATGLAVADGKLTVESPVVSFFPEYAPAKISEHLAAMRVKHLLSMSTGHDKDATGPTRQAPDGNWVKSFLGLTVEHEPGSKFVYNSAATYMLSAIVQKLTGSKVVDYLTPRLFDPLGISGQTWETCPRGINTGGWGLAVKTEDIARFGQLYLQKGKWDGRQLVPEGWVAEATSKHISNGDNPASDWAQGYGYQFWRCRHGAFRGDGAFGQYCVVLPEQDAVLAITSGVGDMQAVLNVAWDRLLPGLAASPNAAGSSSAELKHRLKELEIRHPESKTESPTAQRVSGRTFKFDANDPKLEAVTPTFRGNRCTLVLRDAKGERKMECGGGDWARGAGTVTAPLAGTIDAKVAARGAWIADDTYEMTLCFYETPFIQTLTWKFTGDQVAVTSKMNVGGAEKALIGRFA
jgi:CubicO group peptidase (beta-lactamase class C family)